MDSQSTSSRWLSKLRERFGSWRRLATGAFTVILFGYLIWTLVVNRRALSEYEWHISPSYLLASLMAYSLSLLFGASAWHRIVWSMDQQVPYRQGIKFFLQSNLAKRLPGLVWYALGRLYLYEREGVGKSTISVALILELVSIIGGGILAYASTAWAGATATSALDQWWLVFPLAGLAGVMAWPKGLYAAINWVLARLGRRAIRTQASRGDLVRWSFLQAGAWAAGGLFIYLLSSGIYPQLNWSHAIGVVNSWAGSGLVALGTLILPLGLGLKEVTLAYLLSSLVPWPIAVVISLLGRVCSTIGDCLGLLVAYWL
jgi:hypothetical protein